MKTYRAILDNVRMVGGLKTVRFEIDVNEGSGFERITVKDDGIVLRWADTSITGSIHAAQLSVDVMATYDEQCDPLFYSAGDVSGYLYVDGDLIWYGQIASRAWSEAFNRPKNYCKRIVFSDFAVLKRIYANDLEYCPLGDVFKVRDFIRGCVGAIGPIGLSRIVFKENREWGMGGNSYEDLMLDSSVCYLDPETKLEPRTAYDVLDSILRSLSLHIVQNAGQIIVFQTCGNSIGDQWGTALTRLTIAGADATVSSADTVSRIDIKYDAANAAVLARGYSYEDETVHHALSLTSSARGVQFIGDANLGRWDITRKYIVVDDSEEISVCLGLCMGGRYIAGDLNYSNMNEVLSSGYTAAPLSLSAVFKRCGTGTVPYGYTNNANQQLKLLKKFKIFKNKK